MEILGFEIKRKKEDKMQPSPITPGSDDGSSIIDTSAGSSAGYFGTSLDLESVIKNENDLIKNYRMTSLYSDCDNAIDEIINEVIVSENGKSIVEIDLSEIKDLSSTIKTKVNLEFKEILKLLKFSTNAYDLVRDWYIDGRLYFYVILNENKSDGIQELRYVDSRKIKKIKNVKKKKNTAGIDIVEAVEEYFIYNDKGISETSSTGIKLSLDSVIYAPSGYVDKNSGHILSYLHKATKVVNQLKYVEDSLVIYRISRAPERRIFYVDVGNLPKLKAEQYVNDLMSKYKNKIVYDANTGLVRDERKHLSMMDDFWMPRRGGDKSGTEITTLPGGQSLGQIDDIEYFQKKLFGALNVPASRMQPSGGMFDIGRSSVISRDEIKFSKFVDRLRSKFSKVFKDSLRIQLISKGIISQDDWDLISDNIQFNFQHDNMYAEIKENDILVQRLNTLQLADTYVGKYFDKQWIQKNILKQSEEDIKSIDDNNAKLNISTEPQIEEEK